MSTIDNLRLFTKALESGEYTQGKGKLRTPLYKKDWQGEVIRHNGEPTTIGYANCCLGVACEVYMKTHDDVMHSPDGNGYVYQRSDGTPRWENGILPPQVWVWLGVDDDNPTIAGQNPQWAERPLDATTANDKVGMSFPQIAAAFRARYGVTS